ncbi:hypothetical protein CO608_08425 [Lysobacteraceae bacterium NML08-0793]|nr:hypothetical protein CO608_08425 [Xanthomonadaceae bacterium NML08-0793]
MPEPLLTPLDSLPRHSDIFLWADYVELLCLCGRNGFVSRGNLQAQVQEAQDLQADSPLADDLDSPDGQDAQAWQDDRLAARWSDIHLRLQARSKHYPGWPFTLERDGLRLAFEANHPGHRLYAALLIASTLRLCHKKRTPEVASAFEEIAFHWLRHALNEQWTVRPFGAHQRLPGAYSGTLRQKFEALAQDICARCITQVNNPRNSGDGGIDLVAWMDMGDTRGHMPIVFGQCACSPDEWETKQLTVTPSAIEAHVLPQHPGAAFCFVPHDLSDGARWQQADKLKRTVMVDRLRLLSLFDKRQWRDVPPLPFVHEAHQLDVVAVT